MMSRTGNERGFTLMEVMVATVILSLGAVLIYESFFLSLNTFNYCYDYLNVSSWADEKIWEAQDGISRLGAEANLKTAGEFTKNNKNFVWNLSDNLIDENQKLYAIDLVLSWREGHRIEKIARTAFAIYEKKE